LQLEAMLCKDDAWKGKMAAPCIRNELMNNFVHISSLFSAVQVVFKVMIGFVMFIMGPLTERVSNYYFDHSQH
jgi:hypothetical protein